MKLHPRHELYQAASIDIQKAVTDAVAKHVDLTHAELQNILLTVALSWNKYAIADERQDDGPVGERETA